MLEYAPHPCDRYIYSCNVCRVIDGDTVVLDIDLGCEMWIRNQHCRLIGIDAPEKHTETRAAGEASKARLETLLAEASQILVRTHYDRTGSFRRLLVQIWADGININNQLVDEGYAVPMPMDG